VGRDLLVDERPHRGPEHLVLLVEDLHRGECAPGGRGLSTAAAMRQE
jgi:hypothetical protein